MTLQTRIESAMRDAMRARDQRRTSTLRMAMAAAHNREIEVGRPLTDDEVTEVLSRQVKQRRESVEQFRSGGREEMAVNEEAEAEILAEFLPEQLSAAELEALVAQAVADTGAASSSDMGRVMGAVMPHVKGRADGKAVSEAVRRRLGAA
ncbi:MAG TPA: GatB/YqeY domain-containing protein [Candidatus Limnocylindrales bacterium]|nr:GatB/YqeY domain-containing protein [Candidatus Limnocylindrales bacterium]